MTHEDVSGIVEHRVACAALLRGLRALLSADVRHTGAMGVSPSADTRQTTTKPADLTDVINALAAAGGFDVTRLRRLVDSKWGDAANGQDQDDASCIAFGERCASTAGAETAFDPRVTLALLPCCSPLSRLFGRPRDDPRDQRSSPPSGDDGHWFAPAAAPHAVVAQLNAHLRAIRVPDPSWCVELLVAALQRCHSLAVVSPDRGDGSEVARADEALAAAAVAAALAQRLRQHASDDRESLLRDARFRLLQISLGGIQRFIFRTQPAADGDDRTEKGRAKSLRARSFFVSLLGFASARLLLQRLQLPATNIIVDAAGHTVLLLPQTAETDRRVTDALAQLRQWCLDHLGGVIRLDAAISPPIGSAHFQGAGLLQVLRNLEQHVQRERLAFTADAFRAPQDGLWSPPDAWLMRTPGLPTDGEAFARLMRRLGETLPRAQRLAILASALSQAVDEVVTIDLPGDLRAVVLDSQPDEQGLAPPNVYDLGLQDESGRPAIRAARFVPIATAEDAAAARAQSAAMAPRDRTSPGEGRPDGRHDEVTIREGQPLPFDWLAAHATDEEGRPLPHAMLGVLKADVDRLGRAMAYGMSAAGGTGTEGAGGGASLPRLASISRHLDAFFRDFLSRMQRERYPAIYTVFAGGDDLFLIGPWFDINRFTADLHRWFTRLTDDHPEVTLSAGLAFLHAGMPVRSMAASAESALDESKDSGRNRVTLWGSTLAWPDYLAALELSRLLRVAATPVDGAGREDGGEEAPRAFLQRLLNYGLMAQRASAALERGQPVTLADLKWRSQLSYDLRRNLVVRGEDGEDDIAGRGHAGNEARRQLRERLFHLTSGQADQLRVAATITLYALRKETRS